MELEIKFDDNALIRSIDIHGRKLKEVICMEEMAELAKELSKDIRGETRTDNLVEEFADVLICMRMISIIHNIKPEDVQPIINSKIERQIKRDEHGGAFW